jgi:hypothetical protein
MNKSKKLDYQLFIDRAMRDIVKYVLGEVALYGLYDEHHFFISFLTQYRGVVLSTRMRERYPTEMTIVLQHQFENLTVSDTQFSVSLSFDGIRETIVIPFNSLIAFVDPSTKFALQFKRNDVLESQNISQAEQSSTEKSSDVAQHPRYQKDGNVITISRFSGGAASSNDKS